jgi:integrase
MATGGVQWAPDTVGVHQSSPTQRRGNEVAAYDRRAARRWLMSFMETATRTETQTSLACCLPSRRSQLSCDVRAAASNDRSPKATFTWSESAGPSGWSEPNWNGSSSNCAPKAMAGRRRILAAETTPSKYRGRDGRWHARVTMGVRLDGTPDRKHLSRSSKAELDRAVRQLEQSRDTGRYSWTEADSTLQQWLEHWLETILPMSVRWKTLSTYRSQMRLHVIPALGRVRLSELRPETLEQLYRRLLDAGRSPHVVHAVHRVLRSALNEALRRKRIASNPALIAKPPRVPVVEVRPLTRDECRAILEAATRRRNTARWSVALALGLRQGEALAIGWSDIDWDAGTLRVRRSVQRRTWEHGCAAVGVGEVAECGQRRGAECPSRRHGGILFVETKTSASRRTVVLPAPLLRQFHTHRLAQAEERLKVGSLWCRDADLAFPDELGMPIDPARDRREWKHLLKAAGVRDVRLHDARHTAATLLLVQGVDLRTVMAIMGWTEMATAQRYSHAVDELRIEAARRMGDALWTEASPTGSQFMNR